MEKPRKLKKADGSYVYQARISRDGKRHSLGTYRTLKEAQAVQIEALTAQQTPVKRSAPRFDLFAEAHLRARKSELAPDTWVNYMRDYKNHVAPHFGHLKLTEVTKTKVDQWWVLYEDRPNVRKAAYGILSQIMKAAEEERLIDRWTQRKGAFRDYSQARPVFSPGDVAMLRMLSTDQQVTTMLWVLVSSGCRIGEALALTWEDIDFTQGTIRINKHVTRTAALRGRKFHAEDDVQQAVTEGALTALKALKDTRDIKTGAVFLNKHGEPMSYSVWHARWDELRKACGLDHMHTHDVRAVHLTALFQVPGVNLADVMARAGHTDYRSAMRYQRPDVQRQKDLVQQLQL